MKAEFHGTAGPRGWPEQECGCASCGRVSPGRWRPFDVVLDGVLRLPFTEAAPPPGYRTRHTRHGLEITEPDGRRLLHALPTPGEAADGPLDHPAYDMVLADVLTGPAQVGALRQEGLIGEATWVVAVGIDHRMPSETELSRRLALWGMRAVPDGGVLDVRTSPPPRVPAARRALLLGGARSGKSAEAELRLAAEPGVTYVATGPSGGDDPEWLARIGAHRERRPAHWATVETTDLAGLLRGADGPLLIDGLGTWLAAVFDECGAWDHDDGRVGERCADLTAAWRQTRARVVAVSDEAGLGVVPATRSGRVFRDALGELNQRLAEQSEEATLMVAGRPIPLPL
ncbi:bifunctional adenosylcobinamide kinase/adenosylcobinamide-phosphate guanylyltransferase [Streptosporangium sp. KLBMP 9127]|nr:bifunctional adenosylcobinamide kinase/adenosylcobinamide-phosphate guanylyltransferase [Streptosporangium sp. KLBMP 9127]